MDKMKILRVLSITAIVVTAVSTPGFAVEYFLRAERIIKTIPNNFSVNISMWGFAADSSFDANDGQVTVPGPLLTVPVGDPTLTIHLDNNLTVPISIVINGQNAVMTPVRNPDGRIRSFTHETEPNNPAPVDYTWTNMRPGSYIYQSGTHPAVQVQMGLYGGVVKDHAANQVYQNILYEDSIPLFFSEIDPALHTAVDSNNYGPGMAMTSTIDYKPDYFLINGQVFVPGQATLPAGTSGGGTLLRIFNAGLKTRCPLLQGARMTLVAEDGRQYQYPRDQYVASLPAGKTIDAMITFPSAGTYPIYDRTLGLTNAQTLGGGMLTHLEVGAGNFWPVINSVTATPASILDTQTSQLMVNASDSDGPSPLSYNWTVPPGAGSLDDTTIANPVFTPSYIAGSQTYTLTVTVSDGLHMDIGTVDVTVEGTLVPVEMIVDNADLSTSSTGTWNLSTALADQRWGPNYAWSTGSTFTFPAGLVPGTSYAVYGWWTTSGNRSTAVDYQIYDGVTLLDTVTVNQQVNGGQWNLLGAYTFTDGSASVTVVSGAGGVTIADAVRFVPLPAPTEVIVDNADPGTSSIGTWNLSTALAAQRWGANYVWSNTSGGEFTFPADLVPSATYQVYGWWAASNNRRTAVDYQIYDGAALVDTVTVNQQINGGQWNLLGTYAFSTDVGSVTVIATSGSLVTIADAVRFLPVP